MVKKSTVVLFGSAKDPQAKQRSRKIKAGDRKVQFQPATSHPDGTGPCGLLCSCTEVCVNNAGYEMKEFSTGENQGVYKPVKR